VGWCAQQRALRITGSSSFGPQKCHEWAPVNWATFVHNAKTEQPTMTTMKIGVHGIPTEISKYLEKSNNIFS
jgi:hypothetical protein